ncbi:MAG: response regulator transcription factor [Gammaproteobacteria bacterium]|nr:response regulator transcription factor [Gammaproteobacteria bacterium]
MKILLVEDDYDVARNLCEFFEAAKHEVEWAPDGLIGLDCATRETRDLIILDITVPRISGIELCRRLRALGFGRIPIIMLTARSDLTDKVEAFEAGADDYVVKPFALQELESRMTALIRRSSGLVAASVLRVADLVFDTATLSVRRAERALSVTTTGRKILETLMRNSHRVVSRREIEHVVWGDDPPQSDSLKIHIHALREAIDKPFRAPLLHTVRGAGYRVYADEDDM